MSYCFSNNTPIKIIRTSDKIIFSVMYIMVYLDITDISPPLLMGLKINESTLVEKKVTIEEVANLLNLTENYVIGYDVSLSESQQPHYHIHFRYYGKLEAIQKLKQRKMKDFGKSTKLYQAKDKKESNPYSWYGYAVKENQIFASPDLDTRVLEMEQHTMREFKKSQLKQGKKIEAKKGEKRTFEEKLFELAEEIHFFKKSWILTAESISRISMEKLETFLTISRVEYYTWKFLLTKKHITHHQYLESFQQRYNNYII